ncbi:MAG: FixH family protein [Gammaproteobacteria bacterium]|nr:FixH family protein [Gammaproteobacteria bacterium]
MNNNIMSDKPWYRIPYVWMVIFFPALAVVGGIITAWLAINSDDGLVMDDYYKRGLEINKTLARDQATDDYALKASIEMRRDQGLLILTLNANDQFNYPEEIAITFLHPTQGGHDKHLILTKTYGSEYQAKLPELSKGRWYIQIEDNDWRILHSLYID